MLHASTVPISSSYFLFVVSQIRCHASCGGVANVTATASVVQIFILHLVCSRFTFLYHLCEPNKWERDVLILGEFDFFLDRLEALLPLLKLLFFHWLSVLNRPQAHLTQVRVIEGCIVL